MRVLHVTSGISKRYGGATALLAMCREQRRAGIDAQIATTDADPLGRLSVSLRRLVDFEGAPVWFFPSRILRKYGFSPELKKWLAEHSRDYDVVHIHGFFSYSAAVAMDAASANQIPFIIRPMGELAPWFIAGGKLRKRLHLRYRGSKYLEDAAAVHCTGQGEESAVLALAPRARTAVIPLGVDFEASCPQISGTFRSNHPEIAGRKIILFLSRIDAHKGLELLVPAFESLARTRNDCVLVIAGAGEPAYERRFRANVRASSYAKRTLFTGFVDGHEKAALLADADVFVLPSHGENFGMAVVEAMAAGLPVVISDRVGVAYQVESGKAGIITQCQTVDIATALERLLADDELRRCMSENARRTVQREFNWKIITVKLLAIYESVKGAVPAPAVPAEPWGTAAGIGNQRKL